MWQQSIHSGQRSAIKINEWQSKSRLQKSFHPWYFLLVPIFRQYETRQKRKRDKTENTHRNPFMPFLLYCFDYILSQLRSEYLMFLYWAFLKRQCLLYSQATLHVDHKTLQLTVNYVDLICPHVPSSYLHDLTILWGQHWTKMSISCGILSSLHQMICGQLKHSKLFQPQNNLRVRNFF